MCINLEYKSTFFLKKCSFKNVRRVKRNSDVLNVFGKCKLPMRTAIIRAADKDLLEAITECLLNICKDIIEIRPKVYKKLPQYSRHIEVVADKSKPLMQRRRVILQKGDGFLPFLLAPILEQLASFLTNNGTRQKIGPRS